MSVPEKGIPSRMCDDWSAQVRGKTAERRLVSAVKRRQVLLEIEFHPRADDEGSEDGGNEQDEMQPVALLRRFDDKYFDRTIVIGGRRNWRKEFRHQDSAAKITAGGNARISIVREN